MKQSLIVRQKTIYAESCKIHLYFTPARANRSKLSGSFSPTLCPLCQNALQFELLKQVDDKWSLTQNKYPVFQQENLLVRNSHRPYESGDLRDWLNFTEMFEQGIWFSTGIQSIADHAHAILTPQKPELISGNEIHCRAGIFVSGSGPAAHLSINRTQRSMGENRLMRIADRLNVEGIHFNIIILPDKIVIHPIKNHKPEGIKSIGVREFAGYFSISDKQLFFKLADNPNLVTHLLRESSFSGNELKNLLCTIKYTYKQFVFDCSSLTTEIQNRLPSRNMHILGITRGGIPLAGVLMEKGIGTSISLAGCYYDQEEKIQWKTHPLFIKEKQVLIVTDLMRSGRIINAVTEKVLEINPHIKKLYLAGLHFFLNNGELSMFDKIFFANICDKKEFVLYPWEVHSSHPSIDNMKEPSNPDRVLETRLKFLHHQITQIADYLRFQRQLNELNCIIGIGLKSVIAAGILGQCLNIRKIAVMPDRCCRPGLNEQFRISGLLNINDRSKILLVYLS